MQCFLQTEKGAGCSSNKIANNISISSDERTNLLQLILDSSCFAEGSGASPFRALDLRNLGPKFGPIPKAEKYVFFPNSR